MKSMPGTKVITDDLALFVEAIEEAADRHQAAIQRRRVINGAPARPEPREIRAIRERNERMRRENGWDRPRAARSAAPRAGTREAALFAESAVMRWKNTCRTIE